MKDQYVVLTGSKNNAGDFLIKFRAFELLRELRHDREIIDYDAWKPFSSDQIVEINKSKALILIGGPALQKNMRSNIYPMCKNLDDIKVPIIMMGIGWKSMEGEWHSTSNYRLNFESIDLLRRVEKSGYLSSVRDYHTLNTLFNHGIKNIIMTGCPALYSLKHINSKFDPPKEIKNISFSMGVSFVNSRSMERTMKEIILALRDFFHGKNFKIVFHHSLNTDKYLNSYNSNKYFLDKHKEVLEWLEKHHLEYVDISGSADNLINHYEQTDFHIGYRVHAHVFMSSISKPSVLIAEDGRGKALKDVISGLIFHGYISVNDSILSKALREVNKKYDLYESYKNLPNDLINNIDYEIKNGYSRMSLIRHNIANHFELMKSFIFQLP